MKKFRGVQWGGGSTARRGGGEKDRLLGRGENVFYSGGKEGKRSFKKDYRRERLWEAWSTSTKRAYRLRDKRSHNNKGGISRRSRRKMESQLANKRKREARPNRGKKGHRLSQENDLAKLKNILKKLQ